MTRAPNTPICAIPFGITVSQTGSSVTVLFRKVEDADAFYNFLIWLDKQTEPQSIGFLPDKEGATQ